jgi:predicted nucleic acid-binding protein
MKINLLDNSNNVEKIALDGGVLIALAIGEKSSEQIKQKLLEGSVDAFSSMIALTEMLYIICRKFGWPAALEKKQYLLESKMVNIIESSELVEDAARFKCNRSLALADCYTLAIAKKNSCKAVFARRELEFDKEINKTEFDVEIEFLSNK